VAGTLAAVHLRSRAAARSGPIGRFFDEHVTAANVGLCRVNGVGHGQRR